MAQYLYYSFTQFIYQCVIYHIISCLCDRTSHNPCQFLNYFIWPYSPSLLYRSDPASSHSLSWMLFQQYVQIIRIFSTLLAVFSIVQSSKKQSDTDHVKLSSLSIPTQILLPHYVELVRCPDLMQLFFSEGASLQPTQLMYFRRKLSLFHESSMALIYRKFSCFLLCRSFRDSKQSSFTGGNDSPNPAMKLFSFV